MTILAQHNQPSRVRISCLVTVCGIAAIVIVLLMSAHSWLAKLLLLVPFSVVFPGLVLGWYRSYSWLSLLILVYFIVAVTQVMSPTGNWLDGVYVGLTVLVFFSATFSSRWLQQWQAQGYATETQIDN